MGYKLRLRFLVAIVIVTVFYLSKNNRHLLLTIREENLSGVSPVEVKVLLWTKYYDGDPLLSVPTQTLLNETKTERILQCPRKVVCTFTKAHEEVEEADALVFHGRDVYMSFLRGEGDIFPKNRSLDQPWVFFQRESPVYTALDLKWLPVVFNWTMTYRTDSDIPYLYGKVVKRKEKNYEQIDVPLNRTKPIAWTVGHCNVVSNRNKLVRQLHEHIPVDVYGKCGDHECPANSSHGCHRYLEKLYKFYLSFENSLCSEYVTEKFFYALNSKMIPVVYGRADYATIAPPKSFINVKDYNSTEELAEYLLWLDNNPEEYAKYFEWKKDWEVVDKGVDAFCGLCEKIAFEKASGNKNRKWYDDLKLWWSSEVDHSLTETLTFTKPKGALRQSGGITKNVLRPACVNPTVV